MPQCQYTITATTSKTRGIAMLFAVYFALSAAYSPNFSGSVLNARDASAHRQTIVRVVMQKPGDPEKAIESEYETLKGRGTREALELFITRHPDHPLAAKAQEELKRLND